MASEAAVKARPHKAEGFLKIFEAFALWWGRPKKINFKYQPNIHVTIVTQKKYKVLSVINVTILSLRTN